MLSLASVNAQTGPVSRVAAFPLLLPVVDADAFGVDSGIFGGIQLHCRHIRRLWEQTHIHDETLERYDMDRLPEADAARGVIHKGENTLQTQIARVPLICYTPLGRGERDQGPGEYSR